MRKGRSPARHIKLEDRKNLNRILIPVHIPSMEGYFVESFEIFKLCLNSLKNTISPDTRISVFLNACDQKIIDWTLEFSQYHSILDQVVVSKINVGKINALRALYSGNSEPFFTISDADVLFKPGWEQEVFSIYQAFPESGMVGLVPVSSNYKSFTNNVWGKYFFGKHIKIEAVRDSDAMPMFLNSLFGKNRISLSETQLRNIVTITKFNQKAVVGCGHFVAVVRREVFNCAPHLPNDYLLGGNSEVAYIDQPLVESGLLRLCTTKGYAYHMGNTVESWMHDVIKKANTEQTFVSDNFLISDSKPVTRFEKVFGYLITRLLSGRLKWLVLMTVKKPASFNYRDF